MLYALVYHNNIILSVHDNKKQALKDLKIAQRYTPRFALQIAEITCLDPKDLITKRVYRIHSSPYSVSGTNFSVIDLNYCNMFDINCISRGTATRTTCIADNLIRAVIADARLRKRLNSRYLNSITLVRRHGWEDRF